MSKAAAPMIEASTKPATPSTLLHRSAATPPPVARYAATLPPVARYAPAPAGGATSNGPFTSLLPL
jgi:hypothetical protein